MERIFMVEECTVFPVVLADGEGDRMTVRGAEVVFKHPIDSEEGWAVVDYTLPAKQIGAPLHYHENVTETFYVLSGEFCFQMGDKEIILRQGGFLMVPPGTPHSFANRSDGPARLLGYSSDGRYKTFLKKLFKMIEAEGVWPPKDPRPFVEHAKRYDTVYL
jgi:quercetin dioxygenase-like cupin family protein